MPKEAIVTGLVLLCSLSVCKPSKDNREKTLKSIEELELQYEDEKNAMIAQEFDVGYIDWYDEFYEELNNRVEIAQSMNMIFFGPTAAFMRLDTETILHILQYMKKSGIPNSRTLLAWDMITDGKTSAFVQGRELLAFGSLLNDISEEDLYYINLADISVTKYFANYETELEDRKLGVLASSYTRYYGNFWYLNSTSIDSLGYLICGFSYLTLQSIPPFVLKDVHVKTFNKMSKCNALQAQTLYKIATHRNAYDEPYRWTSYEVARLGLLLIHIPGKDVDAIQLEAISAIRPEVISQMDQNKVKQFSNQQVMRMDTKTRRIFIIRMQLRAGIDMDQFQSYGTASDGMPCTLFIPVIWNFVLMFS